MDNRRNAIVTHKQGVWLGARFLATAAGLVLLGTLIVGLDAYGQTAPSRPLTATAPAAAPSTAPAKGEVGLGLTFPVSGIAVKYFFPAGETASTTEYALPYRYIPPATTRKFKEQEKRLVALESRLEQIKRDVEDMKITLGESNAGGGRYAARGRGGKQVQTTLKGLGRQGVVSLEPSAVWSIEEQVVQELERHNLASVAAEINPNQIAKETERGAIYNVDHLPRMTEERKDGDQSLTLYILVGRLEGVMEATQQEVSQGKESVGKRVRDQSPLKELDLLEKETLDEYVLRLNRHPGRRVDVAVAAAEAPGGIMLDYLVSERDRPWFVSAQVSNTGTRDTSDWREQFSLVNYQLTNHDDIFSLDYTTSSFDGSSQAVNGSYERPFPGLDRLRWHIYGTWDEFTASDVGSFRQNFHGTQILAGGEIIANVYQRKSFFLDILGGARYEEVEVENNLDSGTQKGLGDFVLPYMGVRIEQVRDISQMRGEVKLTYGYGDVSQANLDRLGRLGTDNEWWLLSGDFSQSVFLEPLLQPRKFKDGTAGNNGTMANEIYFAMRGQAAFGYRLIPQEEQTIGGFYTVRGYPESVLASDSAFIATAEYRYHIGRGLKPDLNQKARQWPLFGSMNYRPPRAYAPADWDLVLRVFTDVGQAAYSERTASEINATLWSVGVGVELRVKENFLLRMDMGVPLQDLEGTQPVDAGHPRLHFLAMFLY